MGTVLNQISSQRLYDDGTPRPENDVLKHHQYNTELTLYDCLENKYGFYAFLRHAFKEYSIENVLAVVELQQFQTFYGGKERDKRLSLLLKEEEKAKKVATSINTKNSEAIPENKENETKQNE